MATDENKIRIYNNGRRIIEAKDGKTPFKFHPKTGQTVQKETADKLMRLFSEEVILMDTMMRQLDGAPLITAAAPVVAPTGPTESDIKELVAKRTYEALIVNGLTEDEAFAAAWPEKVAAPAAEEKNPAKAAKLAALTASMKDSTKA